MRVARSVCGRHPEAQPKNPQQKQPNLASRAASGFGYIAQIMYLYVFLIYPTGFPHRTLMRFWSTKGVPCIQEYAPMFDLIFLVLGLGGFAAMAGYASLCGRL